jgi:hypothetical protein
MKKALLFSAFLLLTGAGYSQAGYVTSRIHRSEPVLYHPSVTPAGVPSFALIPGQKSGNPVMLGNTWFDTQTYNSGNMMNRIFEFPDGTIGVTWIHKGATGVPDRGTAYNYYNGTSWSGAALHLGNDANNAFPSYAPWGPNGEIVAHYQYVAGDGPIKLLRRENKGTGDWIESVLPPPAGNYSLVWHSMMTSGPNREFIHVLAYVYDDPYQGQDDALLYYRSQDGGVTWDINGVIIEGLGANFYPTMSSLHYGWAQPVGNTIAFTYGFDHFDGLIFKSTDNGINWEKIVVYEGPYPALNVPDVTPVFGSGDGTSAIALDSQGKVHVVFGRNLWFHDVVTTPPGGWYYYPTSTEGLIYWNESMPMLDSTTVSSYTLEYLEQGGNLIGWVVPDTVYEPVSGQPDYGVGLTSQPQIAIDADDNLFVVYSAVTPEYKIDEYYFRRIYSNASFDGGSSWTGIRELTTDFQFIYSECVYPGIAPLVDQTIQVEFQEDFTPGTGAGEENFIDYVNFPKDFFVGTGESAVTNGFSVSQAFPNPARDITRFIVELRDEAAVTVHVTNLTGQSVYRLDAGKMKAGRNQVSINPAEWLPGVYLCTFVADGEHMNRKLVVH